MWYMGYKSWLYVKYEQGLNMPYLPQIYAKSA